jgi:AraC-like DNA-binding protein
VHEEAASLGYAVAEPGVTGSDQIADVAIGVCCNIMRGLCGADWAPSEVLLARRRPASTHPYRRFFRAPVRFDAAENALMFPATWLHHPLPEADPGLREIIQREVEWLNTRYGADFPANRLSQAMPDADPALLQILQQQIEWLDARYGADFKAKVQRTVRTLLVSGECSADKVASVFAMHRRTLGRRLREQGTTFESLLTATRYDAARQLLADTDMPIRQIAAILGYSDVTALTRAFHRWSGTSPAQWRNASRPGSGPQRS